MRMRSYRDLIVWQKGMDLAVAVYQATKAFPRDEIYGLTSQVRRAAVSVPSNIAEGQGRGTAAEFLYHTRVSVGSLQEMETQLMIAGRLCYLNDGQVQTLLDASAEVARLASGLQKSLQ